MKIDPNIGKITGNLAGLSSARTAKPASARAIEPTPTGGNNTQVRVSGELQALEAQISSDSFDAKKVQAIKTAIAEGRFEVNVGKVADGLLGTVRDLVESRSRTA